MQDVYKEVLRALVDYHNVKERLERAREGLRTCLLFSRIDCLKDGALVEAIHEVKSAYYTLQDMGRTNPAWPIHWVEIKGLHGDDKTKI